MLNINIISPELKNEIKLRNLYKSLKDIISVLFFLSILYIAIFLFSRAIFDSQLKEVTNLNLIANKSTNEITHKIKDLNLKLNKISKIQENNIDWISLYNLIASNTNNDIKYSKIAVNTNSKIILSGNSATRESLLKLKDFLSNASFLSDIDFPISNLLEKKDISFTISAKLTNYDFESKK